MTLAMVLLNPEVFRYFLRRTLKWSYRFLIPFAFLLVRKDKSVSLNQTASAFMYHRECPKCVEKGQDRGKNNLGVYDDGHTHCFSCGYHTSSDAVKHLEAMVNRDVTTKEPKSKVIALPQDANKTIDAKALNWLS